MINTRELRIGNVIIFTEDNTISKVIEIDNEGIQVKIGDEITWIEKETFNPLILDEEILLKLNFIKKDNIFSINIPNSNHYFDIFIYEHKWYCKLNGFTIEINSLHKLQNLYFILIGKELNVEGLII
ncbi:MAG: hypothetical protein M0R46_15270 [Candidatus Muirbacterium halophilum]|nr:hypothetical protein [Candidatus Muirbacterium halophilum]